ncbi:MAG: SDR family oxidoreductase, partial [Opitutales bacterium]
MEKENKARNKVMITGASGLLGRAIRKAFANDPSWNVTGLAKTRVGTGLVSHDLLNADATRELIARERPDVLIHAAAERRPDLCEGQPDQVKALNVTATSTLCRAVRKIGGWTLFISTDYVFDGTNPPYRPGDAPNPLNAYGESKLAGEQAVFAEDAENSVLRVPVLYGEVEEPGESAVTVILDALLDSTPTKMDHWAIRRP